MAVITITDADFKETIEGNDKVIVKFFAGWCGSCRLLKPKFKRLSEDERFQGVVFAEVDAEKNPEARRAVGVTNLPFIATFNSGKTIAAEATSKEERLVELLGEI
ncbi:thiol reductase thioredoxin [Fulvitalea axinellae]|uniref:Thiol reductase thioredoxin n=1 Tax=Fulvitalea axinellae TaxID=1182444 RepID=A0AAU9D504_9BACT|nr:thiol reductase thioredoxin [Fulvitalea axinellae]